MIFLLSLVVQKLGLMISIPDQCLRLLQYSVYRVDRPSCEGGLFLLLNSDIVVLNVN